MCVKGAESGWVRQSQWIYSEALVGFCAVTGVTATPDSMRDKLLQISEKHVKSYGNVEPSSHFIYNNALHLFATGVK